MSLADIGKPLKEKQLRENADCGICGKPFGHTGLPLFWRVTVERYGVHIPAVRRQDGLANMLGNTALAQVMGADEDMAVPMMDPQQVVLCETCALQGRMPIALLLKE